MSNTINLDKYANDSIITLKNIEYHIPPVSYKMAKKFTELKENDFDKVITVLAEYLSTNREKVIFKVADIEKVLSMKQIGELMKFIVGEISDIEKN